MRNLLLLNFFLCAMTTAFAQDKYDNSEKASILIGFTSTGSEYLIWSDNVYGGNVQLNYDFLKIEEGAVGLKLSTAWADGYQGYYGGFNGRMGSRFFLDTDFLFGYSSLNNPKLTSAYENKEFDGGAFVWNIGAGFRMANNPLFFRLAFCNHFPFEERGFNTAFNLQLGFRLGQSK